MSYYKLGNNLIKVSPAGGYFLNEKNEWEANNNLALRFYEGDLTSDPIPVDEAEAKACYKKITRGKPWVP